MSAAWIASPGRVGIGTCLESSKRDYPIVILLIFGLRIIDGDFFMLRNLRGDFLIRLNFCCPGASPTASRGFSLVSGILTGAFSGEISFSFGREQAQGLLLDLTVSLVGNCAYCF